MHLHVKWPGYIHVIQQVSGRVTGEFLGRVMSPALLLITAVACERHAAAAVGSASGPDRPERHSFKISRWFCLLIMLLIVAVNCSLYCFLMRRLSKYSPRGMQMLSFLLCMHLHIVCLSTQYLSPLLFSLLSSVLLFCVPKIFRTPLSSSTWQTALI